MTATPGTQDAEGAEVVAVRDHMCDLADVWVKEGQKVCEACDLYRYHIAVQSRLRDFAAFVLREIPISDEQRREYMRKYDLLYFNDREAPQWLVEAYERQR